MTIAALNFFKYAADNVTLEDVAKFCPNDPGYPDYVREFSAILTSRIIPTEFDFDITETINLTRWGKPEQEFQKQQAIRYRRFRIFTNAVGLAIILGPNEDGWNMGCNYYAISLLDDIAELEDLYANELLLPVLNEMHHKLSHTGSPEEAVFYLLAQLFLALMGHAPKTNLNELVNQLIAEERRLDTDNDDRQEFLWPRTSFDQLHDRWRHFVEKLLPISTSPNPVSRLRDSLLN